MVGDDQLGGQAGGAGADVGDQVDQRVVLLVADRRDHGRRAGGDRPADQLVGEREQILDAAASPSQHDQVHLRVGVEQPQRPGDPRRRARALHRHLEHRKRAGG